MRKKIKAELKDIGYTTALLPTLRFGQVVYGRHRLHVFNHYVHSAVPPRDFSSDYQQRFPDDLTVLGKLSGPHYQWYMAKLVLQSEKYCLG